MRFRPLRRIAFILLFAAVLWFALFRRGERGALELPQDVLDRPVPLMSFLGTPLPEVFKRFQDASGVTIDVEWRALAKVRFTQEQTISGAASGSLRDALRDLFGQSEYRDRVGFRVEAGRVIISAREACPDPIQCRVHDVHDLLDDLQQATK